MNEEAKGPSLGFSLPQASTGAGEIDLLFWALNLVAIVFSLGILIAVVYLVIKYRRGSRVDRSNPPIHGMIIEIAWTGIPLAIAMGLFVWASALFLNFRRMPPGALEIHVVGKQWMWKMQHPQGRWENNELHVPLGRPVVLTMTSEDVIHSFFVPAFRLKMDVIPGQYTQMWFTPTKVGRYHLFCAEFCGTDHSKMVGTVTVLPPAEYEAWLRAGRTTTLAQAGERLFFERGCSGCHAPGSPVRAPTLEGIYMKPVPVQIPRPGVPLAQVPATTVIADETYLHDSIVLPEKHVAAGYRPIMPTYKGQLTEQEIFQLVAYLKSLGGEGVRSPDEGVRDTLSAEEVRTRTGFTPENIGRITGGQAPRGGAR